MIPERVSAEAIANHAPWELKAAATRAATCAHCPWEGGACDGEKGYYSEGLQPEWEDGSLRPTQCGRWEGYAHRRKLIEAGIEPAFLDATFDNYRPQNESQQDALARVMLYANDAGRRDRMLIRGPTGVGKTHLACAALALLARRGTVMFAYVPDFVEAVRSEMFAGSTATLDRAKRVDYLVLDDLGAERSTDYVREALEKLLNVRLAQRRAAIFTMNVTPEEIAENLGLPVMRRATFHIGTVVEMEGLPYE